MKKTVLIFLIGLIGLFGVLTLMDQKSDYVIEKKISKFYKQQMDIAKDPTVIPDLAFKRVIDGYRKIMNQHPESNLIPKLHIRLGEVYMLKKDYDEARKVFNEAIESYSDNKEVVAEAKFKIGESYEIADRWPEANKIYQDLIRDYPLTRFGLSMPIYIANYYRNQNDYQSTMNAYETAIAHYKGIVADHDNTREGLNALKHLADCYFDQNRWKEAINVLARIVEKYSASSHMNPKSVDMVIKRINIVSAYQIKDYDVAIGLYQDIINRNPEHPLKEYLLKVINAFNKLKEKGIQVSDQ